jgi:hypothetical protein
MPTTTSDRRLAELRRHIDELDARSRSTGSDARARLQQRFRALREEEAAARAAVYEAADVAAGRLGQLEADLAIAEDRLSSELAGDARSFAHAVQDELHDWDAYLERLQIRAAALGPRGREQAEAAIRDLRRRRALAAERLGDFRASSDATWSQHKERVLAALDDLERKARDAASSLR